MNLTLKELILDPTNRVIRGRNIDTCRQAAREFCEGKLKRIVRSVGIGPNGIVVVVYSDSEKPPIGKPISEKAFLKGLL